MRIRLGVEDIPPREDGGPVPWFWRFGMMRFPEIKMLDLFAPWPCQRVLVLSVTR